MSNLNKNIFPKRLREFRESKKLSQEAFAKKLGLNIGTYQNLEAGRTPRIKAEAVQVLMGMGADIKYIFGGDQINLAGREAPQVADFDLEPTAATGGDPASAVPEHISELSLALRFFGAWAMRQAVKDAATVGDIETGLRRLQSEIDHGRLVALKQEAIAEPEAWGDYLRSLVMVLPAEVQEELTQWLAQKTSAGGAVRKQSPGRRKVDGAG